MVICPLRSGGWPLTVILCGTTRIRRLAGPRLQSAFAILPGGSDRLHQGGAVDSLDTEAGEMAPGDDHPRIAPSASAAMVSYHDHLLGLITQITGSTQTLAPDGKCRRPLASSSPPSPRAVHGVTFATTPKASGP
jgi:hypothetical protein